MSEETATPRISNPPAIDSASDGELAALRKEVIEARNLVIKTDNLLKNLHAEVKNMGRRAEDQERRHKYTSVTAYILFAVIAVGGAIAYARAEVRTARDDAQANESRAIALQKDAEKIKAADQVRREASEKALRVYDLLASEKEGPALNQAMTQAMHLDRGQISALESKSIDDRAAGMKQKIADAARTAGEAAFRHQDWKATSQELGRYVELEPKVADNMIWFHLGSARVQTREFQGAIQPLENFIKGTGGTKTAQYAGLLLGQAYEEVGNHARARDVYERAENLYPGSDFAPMIRTRLRRLAAASAAVGTPPATASAPKPQ
ncbi:MAG TPA: tetratricopeptide repeat protein [Myxococcales bacterium]|nr:tetratricopeptide repeat protein [Myxococcales bacterium]